MMPDHEVWGSRMARGVFNPTDWANDLKRDIAAYRAADAAVRKEAEDNEGEDPMSGEYQLLDGRRTVARSNVERHLNFDVLIAIADLVLQQPLT